MVFSKLIILAGVAALRYQLFAFLSAVAETGIVLDRDADGIVVLTGGTSRVIDALELLNARRGKRLLITGVNPGTTTADIARDSAELRSPRLLRRSRLFGHQHARQCGAGAPMAIDSGFHSLGSWSPRPTTCRGRSPNSNINCPTSRSFLIRFSPIGCASSLGGQRRYHEVGAIGVSQVPFRPNCACVWTLVCGGQPRRPDFLRVACPAAGAAAGD